MKKNNSILIIGAGRNQVPIIQTAKNLGYRVIVVSPSGDYPGIQMADEVLYEDVLNKDAIVEFAKNRGIGGVLTDQSDFCTPTVAYIAEKLGLPGYGYHNALCFTNKALMRDVYREVGLPIIPWPLVASTSQATRALRS